MGGKFFSEKEKPVRGLKTWREAVGLLSSVSVKDGDSRETSLFGEYLDIFLQIRRTFV